MVAWFYSQYYEKKSRPNKDSLFILGSPSPVFLTFHLSLFSFQF
jgi:hypothetical protein